jgi:hypothetical protein
MAKREHLEIIHRGADATWNWRGGRLDLRDADLSGARLRGALLDHADLRGARLVGADLSGSRLQEANLSGAHLIRAVLDDVRLGGGSLARALLCSASLRRATLVRVDLAGANLAGADLESANLAHARLADAVFDRTKFVDAELAGVAGLDAVVHDGPSELGTHALLRYGHEMPANFLRGVGLPDSFIRYLPSIIASAKPVDFCSIFICAAPADAELARRLHNDLQAAGVRCWFRHARADGAGLDESVRLHERSIVIWSSHAARDAAVQRELAAATRSDGRAILFVAADDTPPPAAFTATQVSFQDWSDFRSYTRAFDALAERLQSPA